MSKPLHLHTTSDIDVTINCLGLFQRKFNLKHMFRSNIPTMTGSYKQLPNKDEPIIPTYYTSYEYNY